MKLILLLIFGLVCGFSSPCYALSAQCQIYDGASIIAENGQFLGTIEDKSKLRSIFNEYGEYGGRYSANSVWNKYGVYGDTMSMFSVSNPYTVTPPRIMRENMNIGRLSRNTSFKDAQLAIDIGRECYDYFAFSG